MRKAAAEDVLRIAAWVFILTRSDYNGGVSRCFVGGKATSMSLPQSQPHYTVAEYLALERESEERHEYLDGQIYAMAGESEEHRDICVNIVCELSSQLRGRSCRVWTKDVKVRSGPTPKPYQTAKGLFSYPDVVVVCGERHYHDQHRGVLLNPAIIIEVLAPHLTRTG